MYKAIYYKNNDFTARKVAKEDGSDARYFIRFHSAEDSPEVEVDLEMFTLYATEFHRVMEKDRNEKRRHIEACGDIAAFGTPSFETVSLTWLDIEEVLKTCTPTQQRRFRLHVEEYSFTEIARLDGCDKAAVFRSIRAVRTKIQKYFSG